jgi:class 3 adenylate cyclase
VLWNGKPVWKTGTWAPDRDHYVPDRRTGVVSLEAQPGPNVLEIRAASWGDINAGLTEPLKVGTFEALLAARNADVNLEIFLFGCLLIMGIYHLGLFAFRPQDRSPLWFGILSILLGLRSLSLGATYLADLVPGISWEAILKVNYLTFSATTLFFGLFFRDLFAKASPKWFLPLLLLVTAPYVLANLFLPAAWYSPVLPWFQACVGVLGGIVVYILAKATLGRERGARIFLVGFILFFATVVNDILKTNFFIPTPFLTPFGLVLFLVFQSMVLAQKFTRAFSDSERYSRHLVRLNTSLERFIPKEILGFLEKESIVEVELGDHCLRPMSVMFADIRDFTTLSETMTPQENFKFINSYLRRMGPVVRRHNGFVDKYLGDGIMALFPGPAHEALDAALDLRLALEEYNRHRAKSGYAVIRMGIGIHRGPLMLGTIGENQRMDSTVISDTVNAASRLEGLTKKFGQPILVSGETVEALGLETGASAYGLDFLGEETVKGRSKPVKVYALAQA